jgi:hypothetical protein
MIRREQDHVGRLAQRLLEEQGSPQAAEKMARRLADMTQGNGRDIWLKVAAQIAATEPQLQQAES